MSHRLSVRLKFQKGSNFLTVRQISKTQNANRHYSAHCVKVSSRLCLFSGRNKGQSGTRRKITASAARNRVSVSATKTKYPDQTIYTCNQRETKIPCYQKTYKCCSLHITYLILVTFVMPNTSMLCIFHDKCVVSP